MTGNRDSRATVYCQLLLSRVYSTVVYCGNRTLCRVLCVRPFSWSGFRGGVAVSRLRLSILAPQQNKKRINRKENELSWRQP